MSKQLDRVDRRILDELQAMRAYRIRAAKRVACPLRRAGDGFGGSRKKALSTLRHPAQRAGGGLPILAYTLVSLENHHPETFGIRPAGEGQAEILESIP